MTPKEALEILKNRIAGLALNHKIGSRDIANLEIKEIVKAVEIHVIPTLENLINEHEALKRDVARYFDNLKVIDDYKHAHPNATNEELEISLEKEVALYRELFSKITKGVAK